MKHQASGDWQLRTLAKGRVLVTSPSGRTMKFASKAAFQCYMADRAREANRLATGKTLTKALPSPDGGRGIAGMSLSYKAGELPEYTKRWEGCTDKKEGKVSAKQGQRKLY